MADEAVKSMVVELAMSSGSFNDGIANLNRQMKVVDSQFKASVGNVKGFGDSLDGLKANSERLNKSIELQSQVVEKQSEKLDKSKQTLDKNIEAQAKLKDELDKAKKEYEDSVNTIGKNADKTKELANVVKDLESKYDKNNEKIRNNVKAIDNQTVILNNAKSKLNGFKTELDQTNKKLEENSQETNKSSSGFDKFKDVMGDGAKKVSVFGINLGDLTGGFDKSSLAAGAMGGAIVAGAQVGIQALEALISKIGEVIAETFKLGTEFEAKLSKVQAISGATSDEMNKLEKASREMGATTSKSAQECADALVYMGQAGWTAQQQMDGLPGVVKLSIASGEDLAQSSDIVTDSLTAFGKSAGDSGRLVDILAQAANRSNTDVAKMGLTFQYVAPVAGALKYSMEDMAIATGLMANAGIKGEKSGTALRTMITNMVKPTDDMAQAMEQYGLSLTNADGTMKPFGVVMDELRTKLGGLNEATQAQVASTIFGKEAMSGALAIINASEKDYQNLTKAIYDSAGASDSMAKTMNDNTKGLMDEISSAWEDIKISLFNAFEPITTSFLSFVKVVVDTLRSIIQPISDIVNSVLSVFESSFSIVIERVKSTLRIIGAILKPGVDIVVAIFNRIAKHFEGRSDEIIAAIQKITDFIIKAIEFVTFPLKALAQAIEGDFKGAMDTLLGRTEKASNELNTTFDGIDKKAKDSMNSIVDSNKTRIGEVETLEKAHQERMKELQEVGKSWAERQVDKRMEKLREQYKSDTLANALYLEKKQKQFEEYYAKLARMKTDAYGRAEKNGFTSAMPEIPAYATGTQFHQGGLALVHANELLELPRSTKVHTADETSDIMRNQQQQSGGITFSNVTIQANNPMEFFEQLQIYTRQMGGAY